VNIFTLLDANMIGKFIYLPSLMGMDVTSCNRAVIGVRSVVTKNVRPYEVWAGNPAKLIRKRFSDDAIELLLKIQWWNWDIEKIRTNIDVLASKDMEKLTNLLD
jgi:hypothetical protein